MAVGPFANIFNYLDTLGVLDVILPFAIIFTIIWAVLSRINLFGSNNKKFSTILALAISLLAIIPHTTGRYQEFDVVNFINTSFPQVGLIIISLVLLMILVGTLSGDAASKGYQSMILGTGGLIALVMLLVVIWRALFPYTTPAWLGFMDDPDTQALLVIILVFGLIVYFVTKEPGKSGDARKSYQGFLEGMYGPWIDYAAKEKAEKDKEKGH